MNSQAGKYNIKKNTGGKYLENSGEKYLEDTGG